MKTLTFFKYSINLKIGDMSETQVIENLIFSYIGNNGVRFYTPNPNLAQARANYYETYDVYVTQVGETKN